MLEASMLLVRGHCLHHQDFHSAPGAFVVSFVDQADDRVALRYDQREGRYTSCLLLVVALVYASTVL